jgi:hypothetical protein
LFLVSANALTGNLDEAARYREVLGRVAHEPNLDDARDYLVKMIPYADDLVETVMTGLRPVLCS